MICMWLTSDGFKNRFLADLGPFGMFWGEDNQRLVTPNLSLLKVSKTEDCLLMCF